MSSEIAIEPAAIAAGKTKWRGGAPEGNSALRNRCEVSTVALRAPTAINANVAKAAQAAHRRRRTKPTQIAMVHASRTTRPKPNRSAPSSSMPPPPLAEKYRRNDRVYRDDHGDDRTMPLHRSILTLEAIDGKLFPLLASPFAPGAYLAPGVCM